MSPFRTFGVSLLCTGMVLLGCSTCVAEIATGLRPNIIYFMADDLGYGDVRSFGGDRCRIETPHFDRLAAEGLRFTDAQAVAAVCVPSRVAIMTGRYPWRLRNPERGGPWGFIGLQLPNGTQTLGTMLKDAGYSTGYIGKWHLGTRMTTRDGKVQGLENVDYTRPLEVGPVDYGFDFSFVLPGSLDMYPYVFVRNNVFVGKVTKQRGWSAFNRVGPTEETFEDDEVLDRFSTEVEDFIERQASGARNGQPFFLYFALTAPHTPTSPHPRWEGESALGRYGDFVMEVDDCLGRAMRALEKHGLAENTLLIATSDHGAASYAGNVEKATVAQYRTMQSLGHYSSGPFRGFKFSVYEGGRRVPFVARWPGVIAPGGTCDRLVGLQDVFATVAAAAGERLGPAQAVDSVSLLPLFRQPDGRATRETMVQSSVRSWSIRDGRWKLCLCPGSGCDGRWGNVPKQADAYRAALAEFGRRPTPEELLRAPFVQLFDLVADPTESQNLAAAYPERVDSMVRLLKAEMEQGRSTPGPRLSNDRRVPNVLGRIPAFVTAEWEKKE